VSGQAGPAVTDHRAGPRQLGFARRSFELQEGRSASRAQHRGCARCAAREETIDDVDVPVKSAGNALDPRITFSSSRAAAGRDRVAHLFGNSVGQLSAIQAVQLAASLNTLRGSGGGGLNPLGKLRQVAASIAFASSGRRHQRARNGAGGGKYIGDDIYLRS
jgi:translocation and assembly module TamB